MVQQPYRSIPLQTERLTIRRFTDADLPALVANRAPPFAMSEERGRAIIEEMQGKEPGSPGDWYLFAVELRETGALVGDIAFRVNSEEARQAEVGYTLAPAHQGKGLASEGVSAFLDYAFDAFNLHRVVAYVDVENRPSWALLERLRFRREGHSIKSYWFQEA